MTEEKETQKIEDVERMALELAKQRRVVAVQAVENADLAHKNLVMQLFMKYSLGAEDSIKEDTGEIIKGGATQTPPVGI